MINLDDLTAPVLTELQQQILDATDGREVTFDVGEMIVEARSAAGCDDLDDDLGDAESVRERIRAHVAAI